MLEKNLHGRKLASKNTSIRTFTEGKTGMAQKVSRGPKPRYPWPRWSNKAWHTAVRGVDFPEDIEARSFQSYLYGAAAKLGMKATAEIAADERSVTFRFYTEEQEAAR